MDSHTSVAAAAAAAAAVATADEQAFSSSLSQLARSYVRAASLYCPPAA